MNVPRVTREETQRFSQVWTKNGIAFVLPDVAMDFATDYANIVLGNFIAVCQRNAAAEQARQKAAQVTLE